MHQIAHMLFRLIRIARVTALVFATEDILLKLQHSCHFCCACPSEWSLCAIVIRAIRQLARKIVVDQ
jgi:hypothetical protein